MSIKNYLPSSFYRMVDQLISREELSKEQAILIKKFKTTPSEYDVYWGLLNKKKLNSEINSDKTLYWRIILAMADLLFYEENYDKALALYLENAYMDYCEFGGKVPPYQLEQIKELRVKVNSLEIHIDGARLKKLFNIKCNSKGFSDYINSHS